MSWDDFQERLAVTLRGLSPRTFLVLDAPGAADFVQFAVSEDRLEAQASVPAGGADADALLTREGWAPPAGGQPLATAAVTRPSLSTEVAELARRCVVALRDGAAVASPDQLTYQAWREPEHQPPGETWSPDRVAALDPGESPLLLPGLGLRVARAEAHPES